MKAHVMRFVWFMTLMRESQFTRFAQKILDFPRAGKVRINRSEVRGGEVVDPIVFHFKVADLILNCLLNVTRPRVKRLISQRSPKSHGFPPLFS